MNVLSIVGQLILCLSILVVLHECGHFFPAKWFKTRVEKFYLFFNPWFSLFKIKKGETEYGIGWIPFGGYVKISGMIDESMDKEQMEGPAQPWEFRSKPAWQRLIIMIGGVTVNFILGFLIFAMSLSIWGKSYYLNSDMKYGIAADSLGMQMGLQDGDHIVSIGDLPFEKFNPGIINKEIILNNAPVLKVERNGSIVNLPIQDDMAKVLTKHENKDKDLFLMRMPYLVREITKGGVAEQAGFQLEDEILSINGSERLWLHQMNKKIREFPDQQIDVQVLRGGDTLMISPTMDTTARLGIRPFGPNKIFPIQKETFGFLEALPMGVTMGVNFLKDQITAFGQIGKGKLNATDTLGSIGSIATMFDPGWDWQQFWRITAMLSILLGFFNLLPIPALDGGYVLFLIFEVVTGKKPSDKFVEYATLVGFILLIILMIFALGLDFTRFFK